VATALAVAVLAEAVAFAFRALGGSPKPSVGLTARIGLALFYVFHHVGLVLDASDLRISAGAGIPSVSELHITIAVALLSGTLVAAILLVLSGRAVGRAVGGPAWLRGLSGAKIALPYAAICLLGSLAVRFTLSLPANPALSGRVSIHPSYIAAALWPLGLGIVFGFTGGFISEKPSPAEAPGQHRVRVALAGGWRMLAAGLILSYVALLALSFVEPGTKSVAYNLSTGGTTRDALGGGLLTGLTVPNRAALVLFPSMGSCLGIFAHGGVTSISFCVLSYAHFPTRSAVATVGAAVRPTGLPSLPGAPAGYLGFLLVPALAMVFGGVWVARRLGSAGRGEAALAGALAGAVFALLALGVAVLSTLTVKVAGGSGGSVQSGSARLGPDLVVGTLLALAWGVAGGMIGALAGRRAGPEPTGQPAGPADHGFGPPEVPPPPVGPGGLP